MAKCTSTNIKRQKRHVKEIRRKEDTEQRIQKQIRKAERKDIVLSIIFLIVALFLVGSLVYAGISLIISTFFS
jgi:maltodextrin utilization protein YvdJ